MPIYKTFHFQRIHFPILKNNFFSRRIGVFTSLGVAIFWVTLLDRAQIFLKKAQFTNMMTRFVFISSTRIKCEE